MGYLTPLKKISDSSFDLKTAENGTVEVDQNVAPKCRIIKDHNGAQKRVIVKTFTDNIPYF